MTANKVITDLGQARYDDRLRELYADESRIEEEKARYQAALQSFISRYGNREVEIYSAPGRSEIGGNHTDHQNGKVLAASVNIDTIAVVAKTEDSAITMKSEGYDEISVDLSHPEPSAQEQGTSLALIRGVAAGLIKRGYKVGGFVGYCVTEVLSGSGLSSSAAYEVLIGQILNGLYNEGKISTIEIAQIAQEAENQYFGKPCGLMDQMASSVGGLISIDFSDADSPLVVPINVDFAQSGFSLCIIDTKGSHSDLTDEYAAVHAEMKAVSACFGCRVLNEVKKADFYSAIPEVRMQCGDRAVLRAMHWFDEMERVDQEAAALENGDFQKFLSLVNASGASSYQLLQNVYSTKDSRRQEVALAIMWGKRILNGAGAVRVHGGGFAGTIQAFVPDHKVEEFCRGMETVFGKGSCACLKIRQTGGGRVIA